MDGKNAFRPEAHAPQARPDRVLRCRSCGQAVSSRRQSFAFRASGAVQVFPNPLGQMRKIWTLRTAHGLALVGEPTQEFTWFDGYAWTVAVCGQCRAHLGWQFDAVRASTPDRFYGLLVEALREA